jgi:hypothetical protein
MNFERRSESASLDVAISFQKQHSESPVREPRVEIGFQKLISDGVWRKL